MAETPSTWPDNYVELNQQQTPSHYEQKVGPEYGKLSFEIWGVVFDMKNNILTILNSPEVKENPQKEIQELKSEVGWELIWEAKEQFIQKLQDLPDYEGSKVKEAVEKQTIEIKKIPWRDWYAIYESKVWNLVYITKLDWSWYSNIDYFRTREYMWDLFQAWYLRKGYSKIELNNWLWELYNKDWKKVEIYSDEYMIATLNAINEMWDLGDEMSDYIQEIKKERGIN
mgnify:CR=1 FL=1